MPRIKHERVTRVNTKAIDPASVITGVSEDKAPRDVPPTLGERVRWARSRLDLTQQKLASRAGVRQSTIGNIEAGTRQQPRELHLIAAALNVNDEWLRSGKGPRERGTQGTPLSEDEADLVLAFRMLSEGQRAELLIDVLHLVQSTTAFGKDVRLLLRDRFGAGEIAAPDRVAANLPAAPRSLAVQQKRATYRAKRKPSKRTA